MGNLAAAFGSLNWQTWKNCGKTAGKLREEKERDKTKKEKRKARRQSENNICGLNINCNYLCV